MCLSWGLFMHDWCSSQRSQVLLTSNDLKKIRTLPFPTPTWCSQYLNSNQIGDTKITSNQSHILFHELKTCYINLYSSNTGKYLNVRKTAKYIHTDYTQRTKRSFHKRQPTKLTRNKTRPFMSDIQVKYFEPSCIQNATVPDCSGLLLLTDLAPSTPDI